MCVEFDSTVEFDGPIGGVVEDESCVVVDTEDHCVGIGEGFVGEICIVQFCELLHSTCSHCLPAKCKGHTQLKLLSVSSNTHVALFLHTLMAQ